MHLPAGVFNETYEQDLAIIRTRWQWFLLLGGVALAFAFPLFLNSYLIGILILILTTVIILHGLNILTGYCGQISLAQAAFAGVGAYTSAILSPYVPQASWFPEWLSGIFPFWLTVPIAGLTAGLVEVLFGIPALRLKGFYLVMATLAAHFIILWFITRLIGTSARRLPAPELAGILLKSPESYYIVVLIALIILTELLAYVISALGGIFVGIEAYFAAARDVLFGLVVVLFMVLQPRGLAHRWGLFKAYYRLFPYAH